MINLYPNPAKDRFILTWMPDSGSAPIPFMMLQAGLFFPKSKQAQRGSNWISNCRQTCRIRLQRQDHYAHARFIIAR